MRHRPSPSTPPAVEHPLGSRRWWALATIALGTSLIIMDATIVNVALPVVIRDLDLTANQAEWMNAIYSLTFAALLLTVGHLGDLRGRRLLFAGGMVVFMFSSVLAGSAQGAVALIGARLVQGIGASAILTTTLSTMNSIFRGRERGIAFAVYGSTIGGMAAVGPLVGGWLATDVSWRWAFWLNLPFGLLVLAGIWRTVPETRDPSADSHFDLLGATLSAVGMGGVVFALIEGATYGWWLQPSGAVSPVPIVAAAAILATVWFFVREVRSRAAGRPAMIDVGLLRLPTLRYGLIAATVVAFGEFGLMFTLPLLLQGTLGYSALGAGWLLVSLAVGAFLISGATPQLTAAIGQRAVVRIGLALEAVAVGGLALTISRTIGTWPLAGWLFVYGLGVGMATAQLSSVIMSEVPPAQGGQASGLQSTVRQLGSALGIAVLGTLLVTSLGAGLQDRLDASGMPSATSAPIVELVRGSAGAGIPALGADPRGAGAADLARDAMVEASKRTAGFAATALAIGLLATIALPKPHRPEDDPHR